MANLLALPALLSFSIGWWEELLVDGGKVLGARRI